MTSTAAGSPAPAGIPPATGRVEEPGWVRHALWWHVYPLGFTGADPTGADRRPVHGLARLTAWLDYAVELGASGLLLGPIFAAATHGYDTIDHFRIDPRLGGDADFDDLVARAHERGLRILLDGVFNHVGRGFPAFARVLAAGPAAEEAPWFVPAPDPSAGSDPSAEPDPKSGPGPAAGQSRDDGAAHPGYAVFEGHQGLIALNHTHPAVAEYVTRVMIHWLDRGADGWRLDAAYAVPPAFWAQVLPRVRSVHPGAYLAGEVIHGDYAATVRAAGLDTVTQYELWKAVWSSLNDRNLFELAWALDRHNTWLETFVPLTFLGNHDVTRLASRLTDARHLPHALVVLLTVAGTPCVYYGDEQAFVGVKEDRAGGDDAVRPGFPAGPAELAPYGWPTYRLHQDLIGLRRRHPWLHAARTRVLHLANEQLTYESVGEGQRLLVALNLADQPREQPVPGAGAVLAGQGTLARPGEDAAVSLPAHGWSVLEPQH